MNKTLTTLIAIAGVGLITVAIFAFSLIGFHNKEVKLRNLITNKQTDNKNEMDRMWKIISQNAQVTDMQKSALMDIFNSYATARAGSGGGSLANWIKEAVPNVDQKTFLNLQNTISAERAGFANRQKEILDFKREHDNVITTFPNNMYAAILNRQKIDVVIVTSTRTEDAFKSGKDDDINLIKK